MKKFVFFSIFIIALCVPCFAQFGNETITITTYYPSPHGVYGVLTLYPRDSRPDLATTREGDLYYDNGTEDPTNRPKGVYVYNGSTWLQTNIGGGATGSPGDSLIYALHTKSDCINHVPPGEVVSTDVGFQQCRFNLPVCPSGWKHYLDYSTVSGLDCCACIHVQSPGYCTGNPCVEGCTNTRVWGNNPPITRYAPGQGWRCGLGCIAEDVPFENLDGCQQNLIQIGCY